MNARELTRWAGTTHPACTITASLVDGTILLFDSNEGEFEVVVESEVTELAPTPVERMRKRSRDRQAKREEEA